MSPNRPRPDKPRMVIVAVGTRPEAIKMFPLVSAMYNTPGIKPIVVATGQHPGIVRELFEQYDLPVDVDLEVGRPGITLNEIFSDIIVRFDRYFKETYGDVSDVTSERDFDHVPLATLVHGDTTSAAAMALASFHLHLPVVHVEAGLRTSDIRSPFPEELNRQMISRLASFHLAPTHRNQQNLVLEGVAGDRIFVTGNTAIDALQAAASAQHPYENEELEAVDADPDKKIVVVTAHRRENWGGGLNRIAEALCQLAEKFPDVHYVLPLHPNPKVAAHFRQRLDAYDNVLMIEPMAYRGFARLLARAHIALTDSGGIQEEAPALGTPVLVMRETTERQEGVDAGTVLLVGTDTDLIVNETSRLLTDEVAHRKMATQVNPYGDGLASERIVQAFLHIAYGLPAPQPFGRCFNRLSVLRAAGFDRDPHPESTKIEMTLPPPVADTDVPSSAEVVDESLLT